MAISCGQGPCRRQVPATAVSREFPRGGQGQGLHRHRPHHPLPDDELRQWILEGEIERFESNPLARHFTTRQIIKMPAYRGIIDEDELDALIIYISWLQTEN